MTIIIDTVITITRLHSAKHFAKNVILKLTLFLYIRVIVMKLLPYLLVQCLLTITSDKGTYLVILYYSLQNY